MPGVERGGRPCSNGKAHKKQQSASVSWVRSSVAERLTADQQVPGSSPDAGAARAAVSCISIGGAQEPFKPAVAQLVEHLTVDVCSYQMVPGSTPGGRIWLGASILA